MSATAMILLAKTEHSIEKNPISQHNPSFFLKYRHKLSKSIKSDPNYQALT